MTALKSSVAKLKTLERACKALEQTVRSVRAMPRDVPGKPSTHIDGFADLELASGVRVSIPVQIVAAAEGSTLVSRYLASTTGHEKGASSRVLVAPFVSTKTAEKLISLGIQFMDTAGNAYLERPGITILITSRPKPEGLVIRPTSKSSSRRGLEITYVLLTHPTALHATLQYIADAAGAAVSTTKEVLDDLESLGTLSVKGRKRRFTNIDKANKDWMALYASRLRPQLAATRFTTSRPTWWREFDFAEHGAFLGGEPAAELLTGTLKARDITIYIPNDRQGALIRQARLRADPNGEIELIEPFWPTNSQHMMPVPDLDQPVVDPLLICADLIRTGDDRNVEASWAVYEKFIRNSRGAG